MQLTGAPSENDLERAALALFNNVTAIGNRELIYTIDANSGFNVGRFEYAAQYKFYRSRRVFSSPELQSPRLHQFQLPLPGLYIPKLKMSKACVTSGRPLAIKYCHNLTYF
jgi:hypothetical protein